jgi:hypothetical protein
MGAGRADPRPGARGGHPIRPQVRCPVPFIVTLAKERNRDHGTSFLLKSGHSVAPGVLALRAVQPALTLAMPTGGDSPPMGWTPMPGPADGGVGSPPFPVNLTAEERAHLEAFDVLDFEVFSRQDWSRLGESHAPTSVSNSRWVPEFGDGCLPTRFCLDQGL